MNYWKQEIKEVIKKLNSDKNGISTKEATKRLEEYGQNVLERGKKNTVVDILISQFQSMIIYLLLFAVIVSFVVGETTDAIVILIILILNALIGTYQEYKAEKAVEELQKAGADYTYVIRDGIETKIFSSQLVPGDVILLMPGDVVPADCRLISVENLKVDEAALTGESVAVQKIVEPLKNGKVIAERKNMVFKNTIVVAGRAKAIVTSTGMQTEIGNVAYLLSKITDEETPLTKRMTKIGGQLTKIIVAILAVLLFLEVGFREGNILNLFLIAVSLAVSAVPEGLPAVVTVALSFGLQKMSRKNAIVRHLPAVETLGSTTVICSDKTGTLTKNEMTVTKVYANNKTYEVKGVGYSTKEKFNNRGIKQLLESIVLCNDAKLSKEKVIGDPTEGALLVLAEKAGIKPEGKRSNEMPFDSKRKMMSVQVGWKTHTKGAPEEVLERCEYTLVNGKKVKLTTKTREKILKQNTKMASKALRVLAIAYKPRGKFDEKNLVFLGLVGMIDPPKEGVAEAVKKCYSAGMKIKIITGDNALTAGTIAREIGIKVGNIVEGKQINGLTDKQLEKLVEHSSLFARVNPEHKLRIVEALQRNGEIVAVTGDGVNDAPALKTADIGVSMGLTGTAVAKEASDMIILDDNFATIVSAIEEGRKVFDNILSFLKYMLRSNFDEIITIGGLTLLGFPSPLIPVQILWLNLVTDGLPALALSADPSDKNVMKRKPIPKNYDAMKAIQPSLISATLLSAAIEISVFLYGLQFSVEHARTLVFSVAVFFELIFVFNSRPPHLGLKGLGFLKNKWLVLAVLISSVMELSVVYLPLGNMMFSTIPLPLTELVSVMLISSLALLPFFGDFWGHHTSTFKHHRLVD